MKILLIPLDPRPCNTDLPKMLAAVAGHELLLPPEGCLGRYMRPARHAAVMDYLEAHAGEADRIVISADMCVHGGIEMSRGAALTGAEAGRRLDRLERTLRRWGKKTSLFSMITRGTITATKESELKLWEYTGEINGLRGRPLNAKERARHDELMAAIPARVMTDYDFARARNQRANLRIAGWAARGLADRVLFLQDDAGEHGPHIAEQKALAKASRGRADFMPGADEACSMLTAGAIVKASGLRPTINLLPSDARAMKYYALYERDPFEDAIKFHLPPLGLRAVKKGGDVDFFVNPPLKPSVDLFLYKHPARGRDTRAFAAGIKAARAAGRDAVLADCAHCNGADVYLMRDLGKAGVRALSGFAAWNTASNTLGTALAHAAMIAVGRKAGTFDEKASASLTGLRLIEDWLFQTLVRGEFSRYCLAHKVDRFDFGRAGARMDALLGRRMRTLAARLMPAGTPPFKAVFPWGRLFEARITWTKKY